ncbi:Endoglucanase D precursor [Minicystis rosea]|nr:Endoglucanase D precursor [Minicystis rosea]
MTQCDVKWQAPRLGRNLTLATVALAAAFAGCDGSSGGGTGGTATSSSTASASGSSSATSTGSSATSTGSGGTGSGGASTGSGGTASTGSSSSSSGNACISTPHQCTYGTGSGGADPMCPAGYADCNGSAGDGCETAIANNLYACGACGNQCPGLVNPSHGTPVCAGGHCGFQCNVLFNDCNCDPSDGCESDALNDPQNCGGCGHVCSSGVCEQGLCKQTTCPVTDFVPQPSSMGVRWFSIHGGNIYWLQQDAPVSPNVAGYSLHKMPLAGGADTTITTTASTPALTSGAFAGPMEIAADDDAITVLVPGGQLFRVPLAGGAPTTLVTSTASDAGALAVVGSTAFWRQTPTTTPVQHTIASVPIAGGTVQTIVTQDVADVGFAADAGYVYWLSNNDGSTVKKTPAGGGSDMVLGQVALANRMSANASDVFFAWGTTSPKALPKAGGAPVTLGGKCGGQSSDTRLAIAASPTTVYWSRPKLQQPNGTLLVSTPVAGGGELLLATETKTIYQIVADTTGVYYTLWEGSGIRKVCP